MIIFSSSGSTSNTDSFLDKMIGGSNVFSALEQGARQGVEALRHATPRESGLTAESWTYEIESDGDIYTVWWKNTNVINGFNVAVGLQYGHGTGTGGWVSGYDYINPALKPVLDSIANQMWEEVLKA